VLNFGAGRVRFAYFDRWTILGGAQTTQNGPTIKIGGFS